MKMKKFPNGLLTKLRLLVHNQPKQDELLTAIRNAQASYIAGDSPQKTFDRILRTIIDMTGSQYGFLDLVLEADDGSKYKRSLAISDISWDEDSRQLYQQLVSRNLLFQEKNNLSSAPLRNGEIIISNQPSTDPRSGGTPKGHPAIHSFLGIPMFFGGRMVGMLGLANRPDGYDQSIAQRLELLITSCAGIIDAIHKDEARQKSDIAVRESEELFRHTFDHSPVGTVMVNPQFQFMRCNQAFCSFLGYEEKELVGRTFMEVTHPEDLPIGRKQLLAMLADELEIASFEKRYLRKDGSIVWGEVSITLVRTPDRKPLFFLPIIKDINDRKQMEENLRSSLDEKEVLLREIHHRVKNNLAAILGLIEMERHTVSSPVDDSLLTELGNRIMSMATIHEKLYTSENLSRLDFQDYLETFISYLRTIYNPPCKIVTYVEAQGVDLDLDVAVPCGLIVNELVTNTFKYAFPEGKPGVSGVEHCEIHVGMQRKDFSYILKIGDNGVGIPASMDWRETRTLGLRLVRMLTEHQLGGKMTFDGSQGACFTLQFGAGKKGMRQ